MLTVTIDRTSLTLDDLVIGDMPPSGGGFWVAEVSRPTPDYRRTYATSPFLNGAVQTAAVLEQTEVVLTIHAEAASSAALATLRTELRDALAQFVFDLTVTEDGVTETYQADCAAPAWNAYASGYAAAHLSTATVTVPVYPIAS